MFFVLAFLCGKEVTKIDTVLRDSQRSGNSKKYVNYPHKTKERWR